MTKTSAEECPQCGTKLVGAGVYRDGNWKTAWFEPQAVDGVWIGHSTSRCRTARAGLQPGPVQNEGREKGAIVCCEAEATGLEGEHDDGCLRGKT